MTISPKTIAIAAALFAHSVLGHAGPAHAIPIGFPDVSFAEVEITQDCTFGNQCDAPQSATRQDTVVLSPQAQPTKSKRDFAGTNR